jgi:hypothetical protein
VVVVLVSICRASAKLRNAFTKCVSLFGFVVEAVAEDLGLDVVKPAVHLGKVIAGPACRADSFIRPLSTIPGKRR